MADNSKPEKTISGEDLFDAIEIGKKIADIEATMEQLIIGYTNTARIDASVGADIADEYYRELARDAAYRSAVNDAKTAAYESKLFAALSGRREYLRGRLREMG